ncbi:hypothetical protein LJR009_002396 [Bosea sp. LjRoot9]
MPDTRSGPDTVQFEQLLPEGIVLAPGNVYGLSQSAGRFLRFNVAQSGDPAPVQRARRGDGERRAARGAGTD